MPKQFLASLPIFAIGQYAKRGSYWLHQIRELAGLRLAQLIALLLLPLFVILSMVLLGYWSSYQQAEDIARTQMARNIDQVSLKIAELLLPIRSLVRVVANIGGMERDYFRKDSSHVLLDEMLAYSSSIDSVFAGLEDGSFRMSTRIVAHVQVVGRSVPPGASLAHRWLKAPARQGEAGQDRFTFFDEQRQLISRLVFQNAFDPRQREWYRVAHEEGGVYVSDPYRFATKGLVGITVSMPFKDPSTHRPAGVIAADILLTELETFLAEFPASTHGLTLLLNEQNAIVARPAGTRIPDRLTAALADLPDQLPDSPPIQALEMKLSGQSGLLSLVNLRNKIGKPWKLAVWVPLDDFLIPLNQRNRQLLAAGGLAAVLEILILLSIMRRVSRLQQERQQAQSLAFAAQEEMLTALRNSEHQLEEKVKARTHELEVVNHRLAELSVTDSLTGLWNRRKFEETLSLEWSRAARSQADLAFLVIDVDWFKGYNDHYGHPQGDLCLQHIARCLRACSGRASDVLARIGGEEFVVLCPDTTLDEAESLACKLISAVEQVNIPHQPSPLGHVTISVGIASRAATHQSSEKRLFQEADEALYRAKREGRNRVGIFVNP